MFFVKRSTHIFIKHGFIVASDRGEILVVGKEIGYLQPFDDRQTGERLMEEFPRFGNQLVRGRCGVAPLS